MSRFKLSFSLACALATAGSAHAGTPTVFLPESVEFQRIVKGIPIAPPVQLDMEARIDRMMPELNDLAFTEIIRDYYRDALDPEKMTPSDLMRHRLAERYATASSALGNPDRLHQMSVIDMVKEYQPGLTVDVREESFDITSESGGLKTSKDLEAFLATDEGVKVVSSLSEKQFNALTKLMRELKEKEQAVEGRDVGDGSNLALRGWRLDYDGTNIRAYHENTPGSGLIVVPDMVMGEFGRVVDIRQSGDDIAVAFESGDILKTENSSHFANGIPPLGGSLDKADSSTKTSEEPKAAGEILMTRREAALQVENSAAVPPTASLRPVTRPANLTDKQ